MEKVATTCLPELGAKAELLNEAVMDMERSLLIGMHIVKHNAWAKAVKRSCYVRNGLMSRSGRE